MDRRELAGKSFMCLPDCGFCCTFQPEVSVVELRGLRRALPFTPITHHAGRTYLGLQGGHGACVLLKDRRCSAYDARPQHCRFFPFHVYYGESTEVYVDLTCRGVVSDAASSLDRAFAESGAEAAASKGDGAAEARKAHRKFRDLADAEGAWTDPGPVLDDLAARAPLLTTAEELERLSVEAGEEQDADAFSDDALEPFDGALQARPFYLDPELRWVGFERDGDGLAVLELSEDGATARRGAVEGLGRHEDPPADLADALAPYVRLLLGRNVFRGSAYALVDDHGYAFGVREALHARAAEIGADLVLRARLVRALRPGLSPREVADEVTRFYDADFLDAPTIGGFL